MRNDGMVERVISYFYFRVGMIREVIVILNKVFIVYVIYNSKMIDLI